MIEAGSLEMWGVKPKLAFTFMVSLCILALPWFEVHIDKHKYIYICVFKYTHMYILYIHMYM